MAQDASVRGVNFGHQFEDRSGQIKGQAMSQFGQSIGTAMQKVQLKREEQQKKAAAQNVFMNQFGINEKDSKDLVNSFEKPEDAISAIQKYMDDNQKAEIAKQQAKAQMINAKANRQRAEEGAYTGMAREIKGLNEMLLDGEITQEQRNDGINRLTKYANQDPMVQMGQLDKLFRENTGMFDYMVKTRGENFRQNSTPKDVQGGSWYGFGFDKPTELDPFYEDLLAQIGYTAFTLNEKENRLEPYKAENPIFKKIPREASSPSTVTPVTDEPNKGIKSTTLPTINTQAEYDALPDGTLFLNAKGEERIK